MGGGNRLLLASELSARGLSPRGRGKHPSNKYLTHVQRSIPAWAGETCCAFWISPSPRVYPRVGGGNDAEPCRVQSRSGLSPRGRGKQALRFTDVEMPRSIPAWAGETKSEFRGYCRCRVYPRVGGGNRSSPTFTLPAMGLSPRGRGKQRRGRGARSRQRSIPAWAGETGHSLSADSAPAVYPRVGGGNYAEWRRKPSLEGLSPRGRGKR